MDDKKIPCVEFRRLLGKAATGLSDAEVERMRDWSDRMADFVFDYWLRKRNGKHYLLKAYLNKKRPAAKLVT
jgi:hypothetical protein